jgi:8-oxo-dGTP diphosphatase
MGSGDGWAFCALGHRHWGVHGAAGLLLRAPDEFGVRHVLLQHRAAWSHEGGTWAVPGGARHLDESPEQAALREIAEEVFVDLGDLRLVAWHVEDHGGWSYVTVVAECGTVRSAMPGNGETLEVRWVPEAEVPALPLHPAFAAAWPLLTAY